MILPLADIYRQKERAFFAQVGAFLEEWNGHSKYISLFTSGSTGKPKTVEAAKQHLANSARATISFFDLQPGDKILLCLPINFVAGKMMVVRAVVGKLELYVTNPESNPLKNLNFRVKFCALTPMQVHRVLDETPNQLNLIDKLIVGGSAVDAALEERIQNTTTEVWATYGMTETYSHIALRKVAPNSESFFTCLPDITVAIDGESRLIVKAPKLGHDALETNDIVELLDTRRFVWKGRKDYVINSGGIKFHPEELEKKLAAHFTESYFIAGVKDPVLGEKVVLLVESEQPIAYTENVLNDVFTSIERPKAVHFVYPFDYTESGKIQREKTLQRII